MADRLFRRAVVIGAGIGGLLCARVLADHADGVVVIERDDPPRPEAHRRYASQGEHVHVMMRGGLDVLEELFPTITTDMMADGVEALDVVEDVAWFQYGVWRARFRSGLLAYPETRPALEARLHALVSTEARVSLRHGISACGLRIEGDRVTGVRVRASDGEASIVEGDLVVDSGGRGSKAFSWLAEAGFAAPEKSEVHTNLRYRTRIFRRPAADPGFRAMMMTGTPPTIKRGGLLLPIDRDRFIVTLAGYFDEMMPDDGAAFVEYVRGFPDPAFARAIEGLEPLSDIASYAYPVQWRRHVERLRRFPEGFLVLGDAVASFDPTFGQGMTTVAQEVRALDRILRETGGAGRDSRAIAATFFAAAARIVDAPWSIATTEIFRFPETEGSRARLLPALHWYGDHVAALADDREVALQLTRVIHLMDPPASLATPRVSARVARRAARGLLRRARGA